MMRALFRSMQHLAGSPLRLVKFGLILCTAFGHAQAQTANGTLHGIVRDAGGAPLPGAIVTLSGTALETSTDREGEFYFGSVPEGNYTAHISYLGLPASDQTVAVGSGQNASLATTLGGGDVVKMGKFTVEGTRGGQAKALNLQRSSENLKELIAADAIG